MERRLQILGAWCGPVFLVLFTIGGVFVGRLVPPFLDPADPPSAFVALAELHLNQVRIGAVIMILSVIFLVPWGCGLAAQTRRVEGEMPILTFAQIVCVAISTTLLMLGCLAWAMMVFRPDAYAPSLIQFCADLAYFLPLYTWPVFTMWCITIALAVFLSDERDAPFPRWTAFLNVWAAILYIPGGLILYFKTGPFAWNGVLGLYVPLVAFVIWIMVMTHASLRGVQRGVHRVSKPGVVAA